MKGKRWELPQKFRTIYWQNFALTASIVMLTLALLGASFFALSYAYAADERSDEMAQKASVVARLVASYASSGDVRDMREMAGVAASMTDVDFLVCSTEGSVLLTTDENLVDHVLTVPSDVMETALSGERYSARTTLGGIYESKRFVVGVPIESDIWTVGAVFAVTETGRLTTMWRAFFAMFLMTSVIVLLLSFVASAWVSMRQSRPIREMAAATRAFAEGNFDTRMHDYGAGEIGELASAFNAMADSLQETERQRREFIANISHELKTPMTSIAGYTDGILDGTIPPEKEKEYLHIISDESRRLSRPRPKCRSASTARISTEEVSSSSLGFIMAFRLLCPLEQFFQLLYIVRGEGLCPHQGGHHQPQAPAIEPVQKTPGLPAAGIRLIQHGPEFLGPSVFPVSHRTLLLQTAEHGDDRMLAPARLRRQPLGELGNGRRGLAPELVHQFPFAVRQRNICHRRSLLPYGRQLFT